MPNNGKAPLDGTLERLAGVTEERLLRATYLDPLTGAYNRCLLDPILSVAIDRAGRRGERLAVLNVDLDRFQRLNNALGRAAGDQILRTVTRRLIEGIGESDAVARVADDGFVLVLANADPGPVLDRQLDRLVRTLRQPVMIDGLEIVVSASVGMAIYPDDGDSPEALARAATLALDQVKRRAAVMCVSPVDGSSPGDDVAGNGSARDDLGVGLPSRRDRIAGARETFLLEQQLRRAIEHGELVLHFQPQVALADGRLVGAEALVRWPHHERGLIPPARFIPLAEETGLIQPLGEWTLHAALRHIAGWKAMRAPLVPIAVNLSACQLSSPGIDHTVGRMLDDSGVDPRWLKLELTETALLQDSAHPLAMMERIRTLGVAFALDDFGTGYSSLSHLCRFPIETVKIDRSFITRLREGGPYTKVVRAVIRLAHSLGMPIIAEGVESPAQRERLRTLRCDTVQGFLVSQPLTADDFASLWLGVPAGRVKADTVSVPEWGGAALCGVASDA